MRTEQPSRANLTPPGRGGVDVGSEGRRALARREGLRRRPGPTHSGSDLAASAAWLMDRVLPAVPFRQWVLSLPYRVRLLCAYDPDVCAKVRRILVRAVSGYTRR